jgi:ADP-ribosyl-[dinitrogen reductase] hydrolase
MPSTSLSHRLIVAEVACGPGVIGMTFCPGKKGSSAYGEAWDRDLAIDLDAIDEWRPDIVVTLMEPHEFDLLRVPELGAAMELRRFQWLHLPIEDVSIPDEAFERLWTWFGHLLRGRLDAGGRVLLHCRGGLGRTGLIAARLLVEFGQGPEIAMAAVRAVRPGAIETRAQEAYVRGLAPQAIAYGDADRVLGSLLGGAVGDAFGYAVEFMDLAEIRRRHGPEGLIEPVLADGRLVVSDDTQMTLFTGEGLANGLSASASRPEDGGTLAAIRSAYLSWLQTQCGRAPNRGVAAGLQKFAELWARRAPGSTCTSALRAGGSGSPQAPINDSKGCGGVMRVAPIGLVRDLDPDEAFDLAASAAALTHGHPSGYLSAGAMACLVRQLLDGAALETGLAETTKRLSTRRGHEETRATAGSRTRI